MYLVCISGLEGAWFLRTGDLAVEALISRCLEDGIAQRTDRMQSTPTLASSEAFSVVQQPCRKSEGALIHLLGTHERGLCIPPQILRLDQRFLAL